MFPLPRTERIAPAKRSARKPATTWLLAALVVLSSSVAVRAADRAEQQVEQFLSRLGLVDLQILHLEKMLDATEGTERTALARRLADLYASRLMDFADDKARYDDMLARIRKLGERFPEANTTALQVMLLQADYNRAEAQITQWLDDHGDVEALKVGAEILQRIAPQLQKNQQTLNEEVEQLTLALESIEDPQQRQPKELELRRKREVAGRATFFAGWANYYLAVTQLPGGDAQSAIEAARSAFQRILGLSPEDKYEDVQQDWFDLQHPLLARSLVGLGLTELAAGNTAGAERLFALLDSPAANQTIRGQAPAFYLQGLINANLLDEVRKYAPTEVESFSGEATQGKVSFCAKLIRLGYGHDDSPEMRSLGELGIRGLARMQQIAAANQVLAKYNIQLDDPSGFYLNWLKGFGQYSEAEKTKSSDDFRTAAATLRQALADRQALTDVVSAGQCRYTLGWCLYHNEEYEPAAEQFLQAATALKGAPGGLAVESAWMAFASYYALAGKERLYANSAIDVLEDIKRDFPNSDQARKADPYIARLRQAAGTPEESIAALSRIGPDKPNYISARFDLCRLYHQMWSKAKGAEKKSEWADELRKAADTYSRAARNDDNDERKLRSVLWTADVAVNGDPFDRGQAERDLAKAAELAERLPASSAAVADYHYKRLRLAQRIDDDDAVQREANWLAENAAGSIYEQSALVALAEDAEHAISTASAADRRAQVERAAQVYRRLVQTVGESPRVLAEVTNARVANFRLAQYDYELGNYAAAGQRVERLLAAFENDREYLRLAGLAQYYAGAPQKALEHWRLLVSGLKKNSPEWHEAKYYQLACLAQTDKQQAVEAYRQFRVLYPAVDVEPWRSDREGLESKLAP